MIVFLLRVVLLLFLLLFFLLIIIIEWDIFCVCGLYGNEDLLVLVFGV